MVRYNNSTLKGVAKDYSLPEIPARDSDIFEYYVVIAIDLTPENKEDNLSSDSDKVKLVYCKGTVTGEDEKYMYNFRRVVFDLNECDVDLGTLVSDGTLIAIYMDYFYVGAENTETPLANLCLYDYLNDNKRVKLSGKDKKALRAFIDAND